MVLCMKSYNLKEYPLKRLSVQYPLFRRSGVQYSDMSNFVLEEEFVARYLHDNPDLDTHYASEMYKVYTDNDVYIAAIDSVCLMPERYRYYGDIEAMLLADYQWYDYDVLDDMRKVYFGVVKDRTLFKKMLDEHIRKNEE